MFSFSASQPEMCFHLVKQVAVDRDWPAALTIDISIPHISLLFHSSSSSFILNLRARFPLPLTSSYLAAMIRHSTPKMVSPLAAMVVLSLVVVVVPSRRRRVRIFRAAIAIRGVGETSR